MGSILRVRDESGNVLDIPAIVGPTGPTGPAGATGPQGTGITILGSYASYEALKAAHPTGEKGEGYLIGGVLYVWSETEGDWIPAGNIQGPTGPTGPTGAASTVPGPTGPTGAASTAPGPTGPTGPTGAKGDPFTYEDFTEEQRAALVGATGPTGPTGAASTVPGPTGPTGAASTVPGPTGPVGAAATINGVNALTIAAGGNVQMEQADGTLTISAKPLYRALTLAADGWDDGLTQTVTVAGVAADEAKQLILSVPAAASRTAYIEAGILCTGQASNSLIFTAETVPTANLTVYIVIQEVTA